jgi:chorismate-pyruvate lyase
MAGDDLPVMKGSPGHASRQTTRFAPTPTKLAHSNQTESRSEITVICKAEYLDRVVLVGHNPPVVFATTASHIGQLRKKPDGHYDRDELMALVEEGTVVLYGEQALRDILEALPLLVHGCPPD